MTRIKINARRIFSLLIPFFFFTSVHAEQTAAPATPVTVEAKNETFAPQHPDQYLSWKATSEQSERVDALAEDPRLVILWAGYPFSRDYNKPRGHAFAVTDVRETLRTGAPKNAEDGPLPMACWSCKSPDVARLIQKDGEDGYFHGKWARGGPEIVNNLGCADCHNTASPEFAKGKPELTLSRPYAGTSSISANVPFGAQTMATPDGRKAHTPLAEGASPASGTDHLGPTAVIGSVGKLPTAAILGGVLLNQKLNPATLENESDKQKLMILLRTFFEVHKGWHIQYNIVSRETLLEAKKHPDQYRDLVVRVAGYSAFFTALSPDAQDDIIARTEHML